MAEDVKNKDTANEPKEGEDKVDMTKSMFFGEGGIFTELAKAVVTEDTKVDEGDAKPKDDDSEEDNAILKELRSLKAEVVELRKSKAEPKKPEDMQIGKDCFPTLGQLADAQTKALGKALESLVPDGFRLDTGAKGFVIRKSDTEPKSDDEDDVDGDEKLKGIAGLVKEITKAFETGNALPEISEDEMKELPDELQKKVRNRQLKSYVKPK